jgi:tetratricopeptide (TPR) repeat protein
MSLGLSLDDSLLEAELTAVDWVLAQTPRDGRVRNVRGALLASKGDFDRAIAELSYAIEHQAASIQAYYHRGLARMRRTDYKEALDDFNHAADRYEPREIPAQILMGRGQSYAACGDLERAIADFSAVIERYPKEFGPYRLRARAYAEKKDLDHALADHDQIVRLRPDDPGVYLERSFVRLNRGDNAGAMSDMDRFVQLNPRSFGAYFCRAAMSILSGQGDDCSLADLNRAIALEPGFALSYAFRGYLRVRKLMYAPAFSDFALAIRRLALLDLKPFCSIEGIASERGKFSVGLNWSYKGDQALAKPKTNASNVEGQCIELATHSLLAAAFGPPR